MIRYAIRSKWSDKWAGNYYQHGNTLKGKWGSQADRLELKSRDTAHAMARRQRSRGNDCVVVRIK